MVAAARSRAHATGCTAAASPSSDSPDMPDSRPALLDCTRLRELRHARGYSARRLARQLGVSPTTITNLEAETNHAELALRLSPTSPTCSASRLPSCTPCPDHRCGHPDDRVIEAALPSRTGNDHANSPTRSAGTSRASDTPPARSRPSCELRPPAARIRLATPCAAPRDRAPHRRTATRTTPPRPATTRTDASKPHRCSPTSRPQASGRHGTETPPHANGSSSKRCSSKA